MHTDDLLNGIIEEVSVYVPSDHILIIGAACRDILHVTHTNKVPARATKDVDLALAISSWDVVHELRARFPGRRTAWQKIRIGQVDVDLVPFGEIEDPPGLVATDEKVEFNVAGISEVFDHSTIYALSNGMEVRLPTKSGLAALKLHAWLDRHPDAVYKDASDLAVILSWYEDPSDHLYDRDYPEHFEYGVTDVMAAYALGADVAKVLGPVGASLLAERFKGEDEIALERFAHYLTAQENSHPFDRRLQQVAALLDSLTDGLSAPAFL